MADKKLSVDDILGEIELERAKAEHRRATGDMQRVDDVIRDILTQKQEEELRRDHRELTEKEKVQLRKEIEVQTKSLTKQFAERKREQERQRHEAAAAEGNQPSAPPPVQAAEDNGIPSQPEKEVPAAPSPFSRKAARQGLPVEKPTPEEIPVPPPEPSRVQRGASSANMPHVKTEMEDINSHFGNFKMEDNHVEESYAKTEISLKNYKEFKTSRNKKVDSFVLEKKGEPSPPEEAAADESEEIENELAEVQRKAAEVIAGQDFDAEEEYRSEEQAETVGNALRGMQRKYRNALIGLGAIAINAFLLAFVSPGETALVLLGKITVSPFMYAILNVVLLAAALIVGRSLFRNVGESLGGRKPNKDLLYLVTAFVCLAVNGVYCFQPLKLLSSQVHLYTPVAVLLLFIDVASHYQIVSKAMNNFKFISGDNAKFAIVHVEDLGASKNMTKGALDVEPFLVKNVKTGFFDHFLTHSFRHDASDSVAQKMLFAALPVSAAIAVLGWFLTKDLYVAMTVLSGAMLLCTGFVSAVIVSFPLMDTADIVNRFAGMMPGYDAIEEYKDTNAILVNGCDLFPEKSIVLHGIKTFQGRRVDDVIIDAASVVCNAHSALQHVFLEIIGNKTELLRPVDSLQYEDLMGMSAWVDEKRVLIGNRDLMINHSIAVPKKDYEDQYRAEGNDIVYLATGGELAAAFILEFSMEKQFADIVRYLDKNGIVSIVKTVDSCITPELLGKLFDMEPDMFKILPSRLHKEYEDETAPTERSDAMLGNNGSLFGYIVSLAAVKKLNSCIKLGTIMYLVSAICGVALLAVLLVMKSLVGLGTFQILLFMGAFLLVYWIYEKNMHL